MENTNTTRKLPQDTVITGDRTRLSYANLFEPRGFEGSKPKYSASLIIPKDDKRTLDEIRAAMKYAYEQNGYKLRGNGRSIPPMDRISLPLNDGDEKRPNDPAYKDAYYINAKNDDQPALYDENKQPVTDRSVLYSGCYARCKIQFYVYNMGVNKGIACSLRGVRKVQDGKPLGGSVTTADDFDIDEDYEDDADFLN